MSAAALDAMGTAHARVRGRARIVSLVPSLTELLFELGLGESIVGRTGFCVHPRDRVRDVPKVGGTKDVNRDAVRALAPTHLVVNVDENERPAVDALRADVPNVIVTHPLAVEDNFGLYRLFGAIFGCEERAEALAAQLGSELDATRAERFAPLRVLYLIWREPWMTVGARTYIASTLAEIGLRAVAPDSPRRYPELDLGVFGADRYDLVLLSSEPYRFGDAHLRELRADPRTGGRRVALIDGEMTSWYGSRAIAGMRYLRRFRRDLDRASDAAPAPADYGDGDGRPANSGEGQK